MFETTPAYSLLTIHSPRLFSYVMNWKRLLFWLLFVFIVSVFLTRITFQHRSTVKIPDGFNVIFCHAKLRCPACRKMESLVRRTLDSTDKPVNIISLEYDNPANRAFVERFHVGTATVILLEQKDNKQVRFQDLTSEVWNNLNDDDAFVVMLQDALQNTLSPSIKKVSSWFWLMCGVILLGIQTAISPCPLTTTIAAIAYIGRRAGRSRDVLISGLFYAAGQMLTYFILAFCVLGIPLFAGDQLTRFFAASLHTLLGPILIFAGIILAGLINISLPLPGTDGETMRKTVDRFGLGGSFFLGAVFALAFCPTTAAMFLAMIALAGTAKSLFLFPLIFGFSTALPVLVFAGILAFQSQYLGGTFQKLRGFEYWLRIIVGVIFIVLGIFWVFRF